MGRGKSVRVTAAFVAALVCLEWLPPVSPRCLADSIEVVVNEVFYDPRGSDAGHEFVELFNRTAGPICLGGWKLETGNGAYEGRWRLEWEGAQADTVPAGGFFVIGEDLVGPVSDHTTSLDLQNGPDGCRLIRRDGAADVVGWGELAYAEYYEGNPCEKVSSGSSIGRDPDGRDSDRNSEDFTALAQPSPGDYNHPPFDLTISKAALSRYTPTASSQIDIACCMVNCGTETCGCGARLFAAVGPYLDSTTVMGDLAPGEHLRLAVQPPHPGSGLHLVSVWQRYKPDRWHGNDTLVTSIVLLPSPLVINEIMYKPGTHDCEWVEVLNRGCVDLNLKHWTIEDNCGRSRIITNQDLLLGTDRYLVLVEDEDVFTMAHQDQDTYSVRPEGGWPTLNDVDGPLDMADMVVVRDHYGTTIDSVAYRERWSRPGISVERIDPGQPSTAAANWSPHYGSAGGSPGRANSVSFHIDHGRGMLSLSPRAFSPDGNGVDDILAVKVRFPSACLVRLTVFDLAGNAVRSLIDGEVVEASRITFWDGTGEDGRSLATGVYLVLLEARATTSGETYELKTPAILVRR